MYLNIYYSKDFIGLKEFEKFFIDRFLFKASGNYLAGELIDIYFYDIQNYKDRGGFDIVLVDDTLIDTTKESKEILKRLKKRWRSSKYKNISFIALSRNFNQLENLNRINFIRAYIKNKSEVFDYLFTEISHDILRYILKKKKLRVFISYARADTLEVARDIKDFIDSDLKLNNFFDAVSIYNSQKWSKRIKKAIKKSHLFLYILSDSYGNTIWTKRELIFARRGKRVIAGVLAIKDSVDIPIFSSNTKLFRLYKENSTQANTREVINFLLKETLSYVLGDKKGINLPRKPDFFDIYHFKSPIIYPEPPLMKVEEDILRGVKKGVEIYTPLTRDIKKIDKKIAISISESLDLNSTSLRDAHLKLFMIELARYLIVSNATLIYGGDLGYKREPNFTLILAETFRAYNKVRAKRKKLINYATKPFSKNIDLDLKNSNIDVIDFRDSKGSKDCKFSDLDIISSNLTKMREQITKEMDIKVALGGKLYGFSGFYPGVLEEIYLALKSNKEVILIYGFGGVVDRVVELLKRGKSKELKFKYQLKHNNKLREYLEDKDSLAKRLKRDYKEIVKLIKDKRDKIRVVEFEGIGESVKKCLGLM